MEFNFAAVDLITALNNQNILHSDTLVLFALINPQFQLYEIDHSSHTGNLV